jgi:putative FmdB family regulatory protein
VPVYEYQCLDKGHRFEIRQGFNDEPVTTCPECDAEVRRVIHPVGIVFKGSGFYATDSRKSATSAKPSAGSDTKSESKPDTEAKPKAEPKSESAAAS